MACTLRYKRRALVDDLDVGECTIHRAANGSGTRWWLLWFRVARHSDGQLDDFAVPVNPGGGFVEDGPGGRTWGLTRIAAGAWQISPSIDVSDAHEPRAGEQSGRSLWHDTPRLEGVPDDEPWIHEAP